MGLLMLMFKASFIILPASNISIIITTESLSVSALASPMSLSGFTVIVSLTPIVIMSIIITTIHIIIIILSLHIIIITSIIIIITIIIMIIIIIIIIISISRITITTLFASTHNVGFNIQFHCHRHYHCGWLPPCNGSCHMRFASVVTSPLAIFVLLSMVSGIIIRTIIPSSVQ